ncbi:BGTF surface domain-containing protein [Halosimplex sp. TS25]|uniref:DUF7827 domain-containing protein n=1 Tax=Halosimplex rarum TaxID=3396619 RepID=UPI0039E976E3
MTARRLLAALAVAALLTAPVTGAVTAGNAATTPSFQESIYTADQGETAEIAINTTGADDTALLTVGDAAETNFEVQATVTDADGDGTVTVEFDTGAVHESGPASYLTVAGDDAIDNRTEVAGVDEPLDPAPYDLSLGDPADPPSIAALALLGGDGDQSEEGDGTPSDGTATPKPTHDGTTLDTTDGDIYVAPAAGQTISGETTLDPGTTVSVRVQSTQVSSPFLMSVETTITENGTFAGAFDFSGMSNGTPFEVIVRGDDRVLARGTGTVTDCESDCPTRTASGGDDGTPTSASLDAEEIDVESVVEVEQGAVARIPVTFGDADALTITVGDEEAANYETTATIRDTNGDGRAVVVFRTNATDDPDRPALAVAEAGETRPANVTSETTLDSVLDPAPYSIDVFAGADTDDPEAIGAISVTSGDQSAESAPDGDETATDDEPPGPGDATVAADGGSDSFLTGVGALALGGLLAFGAIAMFLGFVRS